MFPSQMVRLKIVEPSSGPLFPCFPRKWYALKLSNPQVVHFFMFNSQMVRLKIVEQPSGSPFPCFKCSSNGTLKWPTFLMFPLKLTNPQVAHFFNVSLANGTP